MNRKKTGGEALVSLVGNFEQHLSGRPGISVKTILMYVQSVQQFVTYLLEESEANDGNFLLEEASVTDVQNFLTYLRRKGRSNSTISARLSGLNVFYDWLCSGTDKINPARLCRHPVRPRYQVRYIPLKKIEQLLKATSGETQADWQARIAICCMLQTGASLTDILSCTWSSVIRRDAQMESSFLVVGTYHESIPDSLVELLDLYRQTLDPVDQKSTGYIFDNQRGKPLCERAVRRWIIAVMKQAKLPRWISPKHLSNRSKPRSDFTEFLIRKLFVATDMKPES